MAQKLDVLIIGGGVIGLSVAHYLVERGASVSILEKAEIGAGSSKGNAGWIVPSYSIPISSPHSVVSGAKWLLDSSSPFYIKPRLDADLISWLWRFLLSSRSSDVVRRIPLLRDLNRVSLELTEKIIERENIRCRYHRSGVLTLFTTNAEMKSGEEEVRLLRKFGIRIELLSREDAIRKAQVASGKVIGGTYSSEDAYLDPYDFLIGLANSLTGKGVEIRTNSPVVGFDTGNGKVLAVKTKEGLLKPDVVVLASGAWTAPIAKKLQFSIPIQPAKGYSITVDRPNGIPDVPMMLGESKVAVTPLGTRIRFAGTLELSGLDLAVNLRRVEAIRSAVGRYLDVKVPGLQEAEVWSGLRPCTPDGVPVIGWSKRWSNLIIASGHCMLGVSMGAVTGKIAADLIVGEKPEIEVAMLGPERFSN